MTWLFIRFYVGVLAVLFLAWFIHGAVFKNRSAADLSRVILEAHSGGARVVAARLQGLQGQDRDDELERIQNSFSYPVRIHPTAKAPGQVRERLSRSDVAHFADGQRHFVVTTLSTAKSNSESAQDIASELVWLGPFPRYGGQEIENSMSGWMQLAAQQIEQTNENERSHTLADLQQQFDIRVEIIEIRKLPVYPQGRMKRSETVAFYEESPNTGKHYSVTPLSEREAVRFGPFPSFDEIEQKAATTTLGLVLLPAALAIAFMLRPVAWQLRQIENAAKAIADGDFDARVVEARVRAARPLAHSFNLMADQTQHLIRSQKELLQAVSHELRTPLARIRFATDLLEAAKSDDERLPRLKAVNDAAQQLDDLVGELLVYVRSDAATTVLTPETFSVRDLFVEISEASLNPDAIQWDVDDADLMLVADRQSLRRAVGNLTRNALRFARTTIRTSVVQQDDEIRIQVDDDGAGVPKDDQQRIFEPFLRLENNSNNNNENDKYDGGSGNGLGLAIVQRIAAAHNGRVECDESPLGGARFTIVLPRRVTVIDKGD